MTTLGIVQARTSSSRLPSKVLVPIGGKHMILYQLERLRRCTRLDRLVLATSDDSSDDFLANIVSAAGFEVFRGDLKDVLERFRACASNIQPSTVVRLTGDCPLSDPELIDELVEAFEEGGWDYLANCADDQQLSVPDGFDAEVFQAELLERKIEPPFKPVIEDKFGQQGFGQYFNTEEGNAIADTHIPDIKK